MNEPTLSLDDALAEMRHRLSAIQQVPDRAQEQLLRDFYESLRTYNEHTNLVSKSDPESVVLGHCIDAWSLVPLLQGAAAEQPALVDIGSGAGFPGIVLAIAVPELRVTLIESIGKKARFLEETTKAIGLQDRVTVLNRRAEEVGSEAWHRNKFDFATARAVGTIDLVAEYTVPMLKLGGLLLAQKSLKQVEEERPRAKNALPELGAVLRDVYALDREVLKRDNVVLVIEKTSKTPGRYPRTAAQIKKYPLGE